MEAPKSFSTVSWNWLSNTIAYWGGDNPGVTFRKITGEPLRYIPSASKAIFNPQQDAVVYLDGAKAPDYELVIEHGKKRSIVDVFSFKDRSLYPPNHTIWSPDGKKLLFDSYSRVGLFKSERAWMIYDLESRKLRRLMEKGRDEEKFRFPVWFPDSKSIAFVGIGEFEVAVYTL